MIGSEQRVHPDGSGAAPWRGTWVSHRLEVALATESSAVGVHLADLVGLALRRNPRRAHLLVSSVLGKHWPADPRLVRASGLLLGVLAGRALASPETVPAELLEEERTTVRDLLLAALDDDAAAATELLRWAQRAADELAPLPQLVVLGYAETATALGHLVADALGAPVLHSTRRAVPGMTPFGGFEEAHSHATSHLLLPADPALLTGDGPLVLVDDELTTGATVLNTIAALHAVHPRSRYLLATLVDLRGEDDRARMAAVAADLGARIDVVALAAGGVRLPDDVLERGQRLVAQVSAASAPPAAAPAVAPAVVEHLRVPAVGGLRLGGRHGFSPADRSLLIGHLDGVARQLADIVPADGAVHVLGFEELMYAPLLLAERLAERSSRPVRFSTTTRSPVLTVDDAGYAIRTALTFPAHDAPSDGPGDRFAYNVADPGDPADPCDPGSTVVLVLDGPGDTAALHGPRGLVTQLAATGVRVVVVVMEEAPMAQLVVQPVAEPAPPVPLQAPEFGSYPAADVTWLLTDLSAVRLEAPTEEREEAIQSGEAHYAESLPVEYQPTPEYQQLFAASLADSAERLAHAVGLVAEQVLLARGPDAVLVSLARAGTPIGVLMRRWAQWRHGLDLPHYAISIVRGRGIDHVALRHLARHHASSDVMFVDGWTGKGAITRELDASITAANAALGTAFSSDLAVLADTGRCTELFGTRADYLIPSACLNSTVSGLVSRTVLRPDLIGPDDFHGAKFYAELAPADVTMRFIETIEAAFPAVAQQVERDLPGHLDADRAPTWVGWRAVERVGAVYGIDDLHLIKPGVGETTRVLLRRVPWKVLLRPEAAAGLHHVVLLARQRGVEVVDLPEELRDIPYDCVGLIHPGFERASAREVRQ